MTYFKNEIDNDFDCWENDDDFLEFETYEPYEKQLGILDKEYNRHIHGKLREFIINMIKRNPNFGLDDAKIMEYGKKLVDENRHLLVDDPDCVSFQPIQF